MFPDLSAHKATPNLLQQLSSRRSQALARLALRAVLTNNANRLDRLLRVSSNPNSHCWVEVAKDLDRQWRLNDQTLKTARRGLSVPVCRCWLSLLEVAILMPLVCPGVVSVLLDKGAVPTKLAMEVALCRLEACLDGAQMGALLPPLAPSKLLNVLDDLDDSEAPLFTVWLQPPVYPGAYRKAWMGGDALLAQLRSRLHQD